MKGFIEVESDWGIELLNVNQIIAVCKNQIRIKDDKIVITKHTYEEIKQKIAEAIM